MKTKWNAAKGLLALGALCAPWSSALAEPITYIFTAAGPITGTLGGVPIGGSNERLTFTFVGDTSNVLPFTFGDVHGYENLVGTSSISVISFTTGSVVAQGAFLPSDGIFVSIDNKNGGVGFGSAGVLPSNPDFPGNPAYPFGIPPEDDPRIFTYDLQSNIIFNSFEALSCLGFPVQCVTPTALATTAGDLVLGTGFPYPRQPFESFDFLDNGEFIAKITSVPEPATIGLVAFGFAALRFARRKVLPGQGLTRSSNKTR